MKPRSTRTCAKRQLSFILLCLPCLGKKSSCRMHLVIVTVCMLQRRNDTLSPVPFSPLLFNLHPALSVATKPCVLSFHAAAKQKQRAVFTDLPLDESATVFCTATGQRLICVCNETTTPSPVHWIDRNGKVLPKLKKAVYYRLDHKLKRKKSWTAVQLRIKKGFSCAEAGVYTCVIGESRRSVLVTPVGM